MAIIAEEISRASRWRREAGWRHAEGREAGLYASLKVKKAREEKKQKRQYPIQCVVMASVCPTCEQRGRHDMRKSERGLRGRIERRLWKWPCQRNREEKWRECVRNLCLSLWEKSEMRWKAIKMKLPGKRQKKTGNRRCRRKSIEMKRNAESATAKRRSARRKQAWRRLKMKTCEREKRSMLGNVTLERLNL